MSFYSLSPLAILSFKSILSDTSVVIPIVFWLLLSYYIFFYTYTFHLFVSLNLKCVSYRHIYLDPLKINLFIINDKVEYLQILAYGSKSFFINYFALPLLA